MDEHLDAEIRRQIQIAVDYSADPENVQAHLDSWADRHIRARVRIVEHDPDDAESILLGIEMSYAESKAPKVRLAPRSNLIDRVATFMVCSIYASVAVLLLGAAVGLARWMGGAL